jgi:cell division protein FtsQ
MRPVNATQKAGRSRAQAGRRSAPPVARVNAGSRTYKRGGKESGGLFRRLGAALLERFQFRRPVLTLTAGLLALTAIIALFASGYVRSGVQKLHKAANIIVADAGFGISQIQLSGNTRTAPHDIAGALGFAAGDSIFGADVHAARTRLMQLPWVADAEVRRRYPDDITVSVMEKLPFALWQAPDGVYLIERDGRVITNKGLGEFARLPHLIGLGAPTAAADLIDALASHRAVAGRVKGMQRVGERRWNLILDDGVIVQLPEKDWQYEIGVLEHLIVDKGILERDITEIDLRSKATYFFLLRDGDKKQAERGKAA